MMRLPLGAHISKGLEAVRDVQEKVKKQELEMRLELQGGDSPQFNLFSEADNAANQEAHEGVG